MSRWMSTHARLLLALVVAIVAPAGVRAQATGPVPLYLAYNDASACQGEPDVSC